MSIDSVSASFCELDPAVGDQAISIFGGHLDDAILSDRGALARPGLHGADPWRRLEADIDRLRRLQFFGHSSVVLEDALLGIGLLTQSRNCAVESTGEWETGNRGVL